MRQQALISQKTGLPYLLYLPPDYDPAQPSALSLFLHGLGERGTDLERITMYGFPKEIEAGKDFPFIAVSPQCPITSEWWMPKTTSDLVALLDEIEASYNIDPDRIYVTGLSMGGFGTWALGIRQPQRFAALIPICGGGDYHMVGLLKDVPIWVFHGDKDDKVPLSYSQEMVDALQAVGSKVKFTVYAGVGHNSWAQTYANPDVIEWLVQQKKSS